MARMGDKNQPRPAGPSYSPYHVKRQAKGGGFAPNSKQDSSGH